MCNFGHCNRPLVEFGGASSELPLFTGLVGVFWIVEICEKI